MDIFIYSDESGVFDKVHNQIYVFGGLIFLGKEAKDDFSRRYISVEKIVRNCIGVNAPSELKASNIDNKYKSKLYRSLNPAIKFGVVINQSDVFDNIFDNKKSKQRYLDYAYKMAVKRRLQQLIGDGTLNPDEIDNIRFFVDEHTTATDGHYELREGLEAEFKNGTYHDNYTKYYPPIFPKMQRVVLEFKNSATSTLVRAADIVANNIYHKALQCDTLAGDEIPAWRTANNLSVISLPTQKTIRVEHTIENAADEKSLCDELC